MFRSGGYGQLICDGPATGTDRYGRVIEKEHDGFACNHCNVVVLVNARERAADIGGFCRRCTSLICGPCVDADRCRPMERWLEEQERKIEAAIERRRAWND
jgi:hypothetical protein